MRLLLSVFLFPLSVLSDTLVVDNTTMFGMFNCEGFAVSSTYSTIQGAVDASKNNDTIKICKGSYNESITISNSNKITFTNGADATSPTDVDWYSDQHVLTIGGTGGSSDKSQNTKVENISFRQTGNSANYYAIYLQEGNNIEIDNVVIDAGKATAIYSKDGSFKGNGIYKNLDITTQAHGIYINQGDQQTFENIDMTLSGTSANYKGVYIGQNVGDLNHQFKNLTFSVSLQPAIWVTKGSDMLFDGISVQASGYSVNSAAIVTDENVNPNGNLTFSDIDIKINAGIGLDVHKAWDSTYTNVSIEGSSQHGVYLRQNVQGHSEFKNVSIQANGGYGLYIGKGRDILFEDVDISGVSGNGYVIYMHPNAQGSHTFKNITAMTNAQGIYVNTSSGVSFDGINIKGNGTSSNYFGIWTDDNVNGNVIVKNSDINTTGYALRINKGYPDIQSSKFVSKDEKVLYLTANTNNVKVTDSCFHKDSSNLNSYGIFLYNDRSNADISNSCFYGTPSSNLAYAKMSGNDFSGNYWDGVSGSYSFNKVLDNSPLASCSNNCGLQDSVLPKAEYRMDECSWSGATNEVKDSSQNGYHGSVNGGADTAEGKVCRGGDFTQNSANDYITIPNETMDGLNQLSVSFWVKIPQNGSNSQYILNSSSNTGVKLYLYKWGYHNNKVYFYFNKTSSNQTSSSSVVLSDYIWDDQWHHIVVQRRDDSYGYVYLDGVYQGRGSYSYPNSLEISNLAVGNNGNISSDLEGYLDELSIYDTEIDEDTIQALYSASRECGSCQDDQNDSSVNNSFDAWDTFRDINDRNISTKIASQSFNLVIASFDENSDLQDYNGTVQVRLVNATTCPSGDDSLTSFVNVDLSNKTNEVSFTLDKAVKEAKVQIDADNNRTCSSDAFAVRPEKFSFTLPTTQVYAGEDFTIDYYAKDYVASDTTSYDESMLDSFVIEGSRTIAGCDVGDLNISAFSFSDGKKENVNAVFSNVGDINITIKEIVGSEFALVDADDTSDAERLIESYSDVLNLQPYALNITLTDMNASTNANWLYMADVDDMNLSLFATLSVLNKDNEIMVDFNSSCYSVDTDVSFDVDVLNGNNALDMNYTSVDGNFSAMPTGTTLGDIDKTITIDASEFVMGEGNASYVLNVDRDFNTPLNPFEVNNLRVSVSTVGISKETNGASDNESFVFYYGRLSAKDIKTTINPVSHFAEVEVYDSTASVYVNGFKQNSLNWYKNINHSLPNFGGVHNVNASNSSAWDDSLFGIGAVTYGNGTISFNISNANAQTYFMHIDTDKWLWYVPSGLGGDYVNGVGTNCTQHPCFRYTLKATPTVQGINSGTFNGSDFNTSNRGDYEKTGVKVFR